MAPGKISGSSGTRNLQDNLSDLRAQVAANHKVNTVCEKILGYSWSYFYPTLQLPS